MQLAHLPRMFLKIYNWFPMTIIRRWSRASVLLEFLHKTRNQLRECTFLLIIKNLFPLARSFYSLLSDVIIAYIPSLNYYITELLSVSLECKWEATIMSLLQVLPCQRMLVLAKCISVFPRSSSCGAKAAPRLTKERIEEREASQCWEGITCGQNTSEAPTSIGTVGLPPNVVFEPKDSEPFTLQSVCTTRPQNLSCSRKDADSCRDFSCK